ncbi:hypothetical protein [Streptosporangium sp. NPDC002524]
MADTPTGISWTAPSQPRDWRTGHPDSPTIKAGVVSSILATWREAWT